MNNRPTSLETQSEEYESRTDVGSAAQNPLLFHNYQCITDPAHTHTLSLWREPRESIHVRLLLPILRV